MADFPCRCHRGSVTDNQIHSHRLYYTVPLSSTDHTFFTSLDNRSGHSPPHYWSSTIIFKHTTICTTPLDEWSAHSRDLYLTTGNTHCKHRRRTAADPRLSPRGHRDRGITTGNILLPLLIVMSDFPSLDRVCRCVVCKQKRLKLTHINHVVWNKRRGHGDWRSLQRARSLRFVPRCDIRTPRHRGSTKPAKRCLTDNERGQITRWCKLARGITLKRV